MEPELWCICPIWFIPAFFYGLALMPFAVTTIYPIIFQNDMGGRNKV